MQVTEYPPEVLVRAVRDAIQVVADDRHLHRRVGARRRELEAKWGKLPAVSGIDPWTVETEQEARARAGSF